MPREEGEPTVRVAIEPDGVWLTIEAHFRGDGADWENELASAWLLGLWERTLAMAKLHHDYGISAGPIPPAPPPPPVPDLVIPDFEPAPVTIPHPAPQLSEGERLNELIARAEQNGHLAGTNETLQQRTRRWEAALLRRLRESTAGGLTMEEIATTDPKATRGAIEQRVFSMKKRGLLYFERQQGHNRGVWRAAQGREPAGDSEGSLPIDNDLAAILPHTRGKVILMLGGDCQPFRKQALEATLGLKELRWPTFYQEDPIDRRLRAIAQPDVDVVMVNRFNKRYSRAYQHTARDCGKPVIALTRGLGVTQVVGQLRAQWVNRLTTPERLAA